MIDYDSEIDAACGVAAVIADEGLDTFLKRLSVLKCESLGSLENVVDDWILQVSDCLSNRLYALLRR